MPGVDFSTLRGVRAGDELVVRFKPESIDDLIYVMAMARAGVLSLSSGDAAFFEAVRASDSWDGDHNRTQTLVVGSGWSQTFFEGRMRRCLESLEVKKAVRP